MAKRAKIRWADLKAGVDYDKMAGKSTLSTESRYWTCEYCGAMKVKKVPSGDEVKRRSVECSNCDRVQIRTF